MSYNFGTVIRGWSPTEVGQRSDRGWTVVGEEPEIRVITEVSMVEKK